MDGVWIGSWRRPADLLRIEEAMLLIKQHSPVHYSRVLRDLARVWVSVLLNRGAQYRRSVRACVLDERYFDSATPERLASTIVHEATHARLDDCGIKYEEHLRLRIETVCRRRELAFAARLPNGAELQRKIRHGIEWYAANPEWYSNDQFQERTKQQIVDALRHVDAPEWLIGITPSVRSAVLRMRRLFRPAR
jgi:hypothetical protein